MGHGFVLSMVVLDQRVVSEFKNGGIQLLSPHDGAVAAKMGCV